MTAKPEIALPTPDQVHAICEYLGNNDPSGHCQKCPRRFTDPQHGVCGKMCYSLAEENILKVMEACRPSLSVKEAAKAVEAAIDICHEFDINDSGRNIECIAGIFSRHFSLAPFEKLIDELRDEAKAYWRDGDLVGRDIVHQCADRLSAVVEEVRGK